MVAVLRLAGVWKMCVQIDREQEGAIDRDTFCMPIVFNVKKAKTGTSKEMNRRSDCDRTPVGNWPCDTVFASLDVRVVDSNGTIGEKARLSSFRENRPSHQVYHGGSTSESIRSCRLLFFRPSQWLSPEAQMSGILARLTSLPYLAVFIASSE
ncbi:hypothetical protein HYFRA_00012218 [Hymenoscyphus fraxineus]|uniref:Uncharacterized protein n=1 Tax=Hymenoscyphus fraxineus TaxID=746836 RepID=A0A9N9PK54_9HELO|nr:hypothetical protein HYFRA_00012218 [Hymenoscyphus fraxineus]